MIRFFLIALAFFSIAPLYMVSCGQAVADSPPHKFTDIVTCKDTARYTGRIIRQTRTRLVLETAFGHIVIVPRENIYSVVPSGLERPVTVQRRNGEAVAGTLVNQSKSGVIIRTGDQSEILITWPEMVSLD